MNGLITQLSMLESSGLVSLSAVEPDLIYTFRQPLVQEIAYQSLTREDRRRLHWTIAAALEKTYPDRLAEIAPILGEHYDKAGDQVRALAYYRMAGHTAQRKYANPEAIQYYRQAMKIVLDGKKQTPVEDEVIIDLCGSLGRVLELSGQHLEALRHYQEMEEYARQVGNRRLELAALQARITILSTPTTVMNPDLAQKLSAHALELAQAINDRKSEAKLYWNLMLANFFSNNLAEAKANGERSLALARELGLREQLAYTLNDLGSYVYTSGGEPQRSIQALDEAREIWREIENYPMLGDNLASTSIIYFTVGDFQQGYQMVEEAYQISKSIGNLWGQAYSRGLMGYINTFQGNYDRAMDLLGESARSGKASGFAGILTISYCLQGFVYANLGTFEEGIRMTREATQMAGYLSDFWVDQAYGGLTFLYAQQGRFSEAEEAVRKSKLAYHGSDEYLMSSLVVVGTCELHQRRGEYQNLLAYIDPFLDRLRKLGELGFLPDCLYYAGMALLGMDRREEARLRLVEAEQMAKSLEIHRVRWKALAALAEEAIGHGDRETGMGYLAEARREVTWIADHAGSSALRDSFLELEGVRRLGELAQGRLNW